MHKLLEYPLLNLWVITPLTCIVSVTNTLHRVSSLAIEIIVYHYMHYLLSRRAKGLRPLSFFKCNRRGKDAQALRRYGDDHFWSLYMRTLFWELATLEKTWLMQYMWSNAKNIGLDQ